MHVTSSQCVECANIMNHRDAGPNGGRLQCRSCGRWLGEEHNPGCPLRGSLSAQVNSEKAPEPVAAERVPDTDPPPALEAPVVERFKPKRKRRAKKPSA